jgi:hypothetical protein
VIDEVRDQRERIGERRARRAQAEHQRLVGLGLQLEGRPIAPRKVGRLARTTERIGTVAKALCGQKAKGPEPAITTAAWL